MSGLLSSVAIHRRTGLEVVPHLTPRDSTLTGLESLLLGAHAEGVRNVLAVTGDVPESGDYPGAGAVYDVDAIGLVELMAHLNAGTDFHGRAIDAPTSFFPGVAVNPTADDLDLEAERFARKLEAGARFAMTQVALRPLVPGVVPRPDRRLPDPAPRRRVADPVARARGPRAQRDARGSSSPSTCSAATATAGPDAAEVGAELVRELVAGARTLAAGVYVVAPFRRPLGVLDLLATF